MTPLASEILNDIDAEFGGIATITQLREWLGEPRREIEKAIRELVCARKRQKFGIRYSTGVVANV